MRHIVIIESKPFTIWLPDICSVMSRGRCSPMMTDSGDKFIVCPALSLLLAVVRKKALLDPADGLCLRPLR